VNGRFDVDVGGRDVVHGEDVKFGNEWGGGDKGCDEGEEAPKQSYLNGFR